MCQVALCEPGAKIRRPTEYPVVSSSAVFPVNPGASAGIPWAARREWPSGCGRLLRTAGRSGRDRADEPETHERAGAATEVERLRHVTLLSFFSGFVVGVP